MGSQSCISLQEVAGLFLMHPLQWSSFSTSSRMPALSCSITASGTVPGGPGLPSNPGAPTGPCGPTGPTGPCGPTGPTGPCGPTGPTGPCGPPSSPFTPFSPLVPLTPLSPLGPCGPSGPGSPFTPCCPTTVKVALPLVGAKQPVMFTSSSSWCPLAVTREEDVMMKAAAMSTARKNFISTSLCHDRSACVFYEYLNI